MAGKLATQFATLRVAEAVAKEPRKEVKVPKVPKKKRNHAPMEVQVIGLPSIGSGSFASMLMQAH